MSTVTPPDTEPLREAYRALLHAAHTLLDSGDPNPAAPEGEWNADQILAHVSLVNATTLATLSAIAAGAHATYDNRIAQDTWTIEHHVEIAGGNAGLCNRIRLQADALCTLAGGALSDAELDTLVPTRLLSHNAVLVDQPVPLRDLITGLATNEIPGHTKQLLALQSSRCPARSASVLPSEAGGADTAKNSPR